MNGELTGELRGSDQGMNVALMKPRVLFLDQTGQLGGAELFLADVAELYRDRGSVTLFEDGPFRQLLQDRGVKVSTIGFNGNNARVSKAAGVSSILKAGPRFLGLARRVAREARAFDLIYANTAKAMIVGVMAAALARRPLLYHLHDIISPEHFSGVNRRILAGFGNRAAAVVANSEATRRSFIECGGRRELTHVVYNGFDANLYSGTNADNRMALRQKLGIGEAPCALIVGRLTPWKGQHVFLEALRKLPGVHGIIAGDALFTEEDRRYAERLRAMALETDLAGRVHFAGFRDDLPLWYQTADMVVHASTAPEPFGRVIVEGLLAGKPVIATRGGGASEILSDRLTGYLVAAGDSHELAGAIREILDHPAQAAAIGLQGCEDARRRFSKESVLNALDSIIESVAFRENGVHPG